MSGRPTPESLPGFERARGLMHGYTHRAALHHLLGRTALLDDPAVRAVHVRAVAKSLVLTGFDAEGQECRYATVPAGPIPSVPEFDQGVTGMPIRAGSMLASTIVARSGWVVDMVALRGYNPLVDRQTTQKAVLEAHMQDLSSSGEGRNLGDVA